MKVPVVLIHFNRPDYTAQVWESIRQAQPQQLWVIADGPRPHVPKDIEYCQAARAIVETVDWPCEVMKNYASENWGCGKRVFSGLSWVFDQVEEAIILEDDCLPNPTFFPFCTELLARYRFDPRILLISGRNDLGQWKSDQQSYHFSHYGSIWGWASWQRAWKLCDPSLKSFDSTTILQTLSEVLADSEQVNYRFWLYENILNGRINSWDIQWAFARLLHQGLEIAPSVNLVKNLGFDPQATHTKKEDDLRAEIISRSMQFPLQHPPEIFQSDDNFDRQTFLMELMSTYKQVRALKVLQQAIAQGKTPPHLEPGIFHALTPLYHLQEANSVLKHILQWNPSHKAANLLCQEFQKFLH
ncbi:MAG: glycosyltransferase family 2 protein [Nostoc sp.]